MHELTLRAFAQPYGLQRLSALDVLSQPASNLRDESSLILRIPEGSGGELGGAQVEIRTGKFGVRRQGPRGFSGRDWSTLFREAATKYLEENQHKRSLERDARALATLDAYI